MPPSHTREPKRSAAFIHDVNKGFITISARHPSGDGSVEWATPSEEALAEFYAAVGAAIVAWQQVEAQLVHVFQTAVGAASLATCAAAFREAVNFRSRLQMVDATIKVRFGENSKNSISWRKLSEKIAKRSKRRNELAHTTLYFNEDESHPSRILFLASSTWKGEEVQIDPTSVMYIKELREARESFINVRSLLIDFITKCEGTLWAEVHKAAS